MEKIVARDAECNTLPLGYSLQAGDRVASHGHQRL